MLVGGDSGVDIHTASVFVELHMAIHKRPNGVVTPKADIAAGDELGPALAEDDIAGDDGFSAEFFYPETFADAVASVFDAALSFFMGHKMLLG